MSECKELQSFQNGCDRNRITALVMVMGLTGVQYNSVSSHTSDNKILWQHSWSQICFSQV